MLDAEYQGLRRVLQTPERRPTFEKVISLNLHYKDKNFAEESLEVL